MFPTDENPAAPTNEEIGARLAEILGAAASRYAHQLHVPAEIAFSALGAAATVLAEAHMGRAGAAEWLRSAADSLESSDDEPPESPILN